MLANLCWWISYSSSSFVKKLNSSPCAARAFRHFKVIWWVRSCSCMCRQPFIFWSVPMVYIIFFNSCIQSSSPSLVFECKSYLSAAYILTAIFTNSMAPEPSLAIKIVFAHIYLKDRFILRVFSTTELKITMSSSSLGFALLYSNTRSVSIYSIPLFSGASLYVANSPYQ